MADIQSCNDEEELHKMLSATEDSERRKLIRTKLKQLRDEATAKWEASRGSSGESAVQMKARKAEEEKKRKIQEMKELDKKAKETRGPSELELSKQQRQKDAELEKQRKIQDITAVGKAMTDVYHKGADRAARDIKP